MPSNFPVDDVISQLIQALDEYGRAILEAPTGAGKSTRVPLALLKTGWSSRGKILMLEPRRVAARSVATFMASQLGEQPGGRVGYRTRSDSRTGPDTLIEVITEGILTRMLLTDPELKGVSMVVFDEFHERSLQADLGLALVREVREVFRPDLGVLVMSATLDSESLQTWLDAPVIRSEGKRFQVDVRYAAVPGRTDWRTHCLREVVTVAHCTGVMLVFLPGQADIQWLAGQLRESGLAERVRMLHGSLPLSEQQAVLDEARAGVQMIILATNVAETSLTIDGVTHVVDSGFIREPLYDPARHRSRLVTRRVSESSARQRAGRAGRRGPGHCIRLWAESEVLARYTAPEIHRVGLDGLVLDLARWGCSQPDGMEWLDPPPGGAWRSAVDRLTSAGVLDRQGALTPLGQAVSSVATEPALAILVIAGREIGLVETASRLAALLSDRDPFQGLGVDVRDRLQALEQRPQQYGSLLDEARRLAGGKHRDESDWRQGLGALLACTFPQQVARQRPGRDGVYQMVDGPGVRLPERDRLLGHEWLVVLDTDGQPRDARLRLVMPLDERAVTAVLDKHARWRKRAGWDSERGRVTGRREQVLGNLVIESHPLAELSAEQCIEGLLQGVREAGLDNALPWDEEARQWQARVARMASLESGWPAVDDSTLEATLEQWLAPFMAGMRRLDDLRKLPLQHALDVMLTLEQRQALDAQLPARVAIPSGRNATLDYRSEHVVLAVKLQELFGLGALPTLAKGRLMITAHLLTPAGRPAAITNNLERFWRENYPAVRKELRGRYPKHPWPEDPLEATATALTKRRLGQ
ncbi:ATP-dependent helicase HrpB [Alcanivorax profundi]|uniref:ATP-dependent helicase HrpB n=1 Tax=Alcanivorax profundi TaxID=2338368 RepID=UPI0032B2BB38